MVKGARWRRQSGAAASLAQTSRSPAPAARDEGFTLDGCSRQPPGLCPCLHADATLGAIGKVESGQVGSISEA